MGTKSLSQNPPIVTLQNLCTLLQRRNSSYKISMLSKQASNRANYPGFIIMVLPEGVQCFCAYRAIPSHCGLKKLTLSEDEHRVEKPATVVELDTSIHDIYTTASGTCGLIRDIRDISLTDSHLQISVRRAHPAQSMAH